MRAAGNARMAIITKRCGHVTRSFTIASLSDVNSGLTAGVTGELLVYKADLEQREPVF